ncbi:hypothetical protein AGMMS4952_08830 [Spirochaetia bacterium]|nr:hypothetical protein AGMMS4952_08830 [Spirochaetia bacterium]
MMMVQQTRTAAPTLTQVPFDRITADPLVMGGKPCIQGMRITVGVILSQLGSGETIDELLVDYPWLEREDVLQAIQYAAWLAEGRDVDLATL